MAPLELRELRRLAALSLRHLPECRPRESAGGACHHEGGFTIEKDYRDRWFFKRPDGRAVPACGYRPEDTLDDDVEAAAEYFGDRASAEASRPSAEAFAVNETGSVDGQGTLRGGVLVRGPVRDRDQPSRSSSLPGQLSFSSRDNARSANRRPPVWHRAQ